MLIRIILRMTIYVLVGFTGVTASVTGYLFATGAFAAINVEPDSIFFSTTNVYRQELEYSEYEYDEEIDDGQQPDNGDESDDEETQQPDDPNDNGNDIDDEENNEENGEENGEEVEDITLEDANRINYLVIDSPIFIFVYPENPQVNRNDIELEIRSGSNYIEIPNNEDLRLNRPIEIRPKMDEQGNFNVGQAHIRVKSTASQRASIQAYRDLYILVDVPVESFELTVQDETIENFYVGDEIYLDASDIYPFNEAEPEYTSFNPAANSSSNFFNNFGKKKIEFYSLNPNIATVDKESGLVEIKREGEVTLEAYMPKTYDYQLNMVNPDNFEYEEDYWDAKKAISVVSTITMQTQDISIAGITIEEDKHEVYLFESSIITQDDIDITLLPQQDSDFTSESLAYRISELELLATNSDIFEIVPIIEDGHISWEIIAKKFLVFGNPMNHADLTLTLKFNEDIQVDMIIEIVTNDIDYIQLDSLHEFINDSEQVNLYIRDEDKDILNLSDVTILNAEDDTKSPTYTKVIFYVENSSEQDVILSEEDGTVYRDENGEFVLISENRGHVRIQPVVIRTDYYGDPVLTGLEEYMPVHIGSYFDVYVSEELTSLNFSLREIPDKSIPVDQKIKFVIDDLTEDQVQLFNQGRLQIFTRGKQHSFESELIEGDLHVSSINKIEEPGEYRLHFVDVTRSAILYKVKLNVTAGYNPASRPPEQIRIEHDVSEHSHDTINKNIMQRNQIELLVEGLTDDQLDRNITVEAMHIENASNVSSASVIKGEDLLITVNIHDYVGVLQLVLNDYFNSDEPADELLTMNLDVYDEIYNLKINQESTNFIRTQDVLVVLDANSNTALIDAYNNHNLNFFADYTIDPDVYSDDLIISNINLISDDNFDEGQMLLVSFYIRTNEDIFDEVDETFFMFRASPEPEEVRDVTYYDSMQTYISKGVVESMELYTSSGLDWQHEDHRIVAALSSDGVEWQEIIDSNYPHAFNVFVDIYPFNAFNTEYIFISSDTSILEIDMSLDNPFIFKAAGTVSLIVESLDNDSSATASIQLTVEVPEVDYTKAYEGDFDSISFGAKEKFLLAEFGEQDRRISIMHGSTDLLKLMNFSIDKSYPSGVDHSVFNISIDQEGDSYKVYLEVPEIYSKSIQLGILITSNFGFEGEYVFDIDPGIEFNSGYEEGEYRLKHTLSVDPEIVPSEEPVVIEVSDSTDDKETSIIKTENIEFTWDLTVFGGQPDEYYDYSDTDISFNINGDTYTDYDFDGSDIIVYYTPETTGLKYFEILVDSSSVYTHRLNVGVNEKITTPDVYDLGFIGVTQVIDTNDTSYERNLIEDFAVTFSIDYVEHEGTNASDYFEYPIVSYPPDGILRLGVYTNYFNQPHDLKQVINIKVTIDFGISGIPNYNNTFLLELNAQEIE